jgi:hypothetical protein
MAWIPKPCGRLAIGSEEEGMRAGERILERRRTVDCSWKQKWKVGDTVESRLLGMFSVLEMSLLEHNDDVDMFGDDMRRLRRL